MTKTQIIRITSGRLARRTIATPGVGTHPMGSRERLALFNQIGDFLPGAVVLDAFAGSGALGIEALSRGAKEVTFVEKSPAAARVIKENLANLGLNEAVFTENVVNFTTDKRFDVILVDPPYDNFKVNEVVVLVKFLNEDGVLALSHPEAPPELPGLALQQTRSYAGARISIYRAGMHS